MNTFGTGGLGGVAGDLGGVCTLGGVLGTASLSNVFWISFRLLRRPGSALFDLPLAAGDTDPERLVRNKPINLVQYIISLHYKQSNNIY